MENPIEKIQKDLGIPAPPSMTQNGWILLADLGQWKAVRPLGDIKDISILGTVTIPGAAKAWVKFDGTTGDIIRSFNVDTVDRVTDGDYRLNFKYDMPSKDYCVQVSLMPVIGGDGLIPIVRPDIEDSESKVRIRILNRQLGLEDAQFVYVSVFDSQGNNP